MPPVHLLLFLLGSLSLVRGSPLTADERRHILAAHNTVRGFLAAANTSALGLAFSPPPAGDMRVLGWMARLAARAERLQLRLCYNESSAAPPVEQSFIVAEERTVVGEENATLASLLQRLLVLGPRLEDLLLQPLAQSHFVRVGCARRRCDNRTLLSCAYGSELIAPPDADAPPYKTGLPCSVCPPGNEFCMNGHLCATASQCQASSSRCLCRVKALNCTAKGGQFDAKNCRCLCGGEKVSGLYCGSPCKDNDCPLELSAEERKKGLPPAACSEGKLRQRLHIVGECRLTCSFCRRDAFFKFATDPQVVPIEMYAHLRYAAPETTPAPTDSSP